MSTVEPAYVVQDPAIARVRIEIGSGQVELVPSDDAAVRATLDVPPGADQDWVNDITFKVVGDELVVDAPRRFRSGEIRVRVEAQATMPARIKTGSADILARVPLQDARLSTGSGDIILERSEGVLAAGTGTGRIRIEYAAGPVRANTGSGDIEIRTAETMVAASTGSGDVRIGDAAGPATVKVGSGDITIERVLDHSVATSGSGDVRVERAEGASVRAETARGDVQIGVPQGTPTYLDLKTVTGHIRCDLEPSSRPPEGDRSLTLRARTVSGDISVVRA
ncbi:MAG: DUF4097 family beta strand repeat-containing protein [Nocardioidaceae bacterium]